MPRRVVDLARVPTYGVIRAVFFMCIAAGFLLGFSKYQFWHFMVLESGTYLENWGVFHGLANAMEKAFPMAEANGVEFKYDLQHILIMAIILSTQYLRYGRTTTDIMEEGSKQSLTGITLSAREERQKKREEEKKKNKPVTFHRAENQTGK